MHEKWVKSTVGEFCQFKYGKNLPKGVRTSSGSIAVYGSNGVIDYHTIPLVKSSGVIIGRKGTIGSIHFSKLPFWPIDTTFYIENINNRCIRFAFYLLKSLKLNNMNSDSAVPGLNREAVHNLSIHIPPLKEQRAIADILGALDDKIELNQQMNKTLEAMAQAIFKSWFIDFDPVHAKAKGQKPHGLSEEVASLFPDSFEESELGIIPKGWKNTTLGDLCCSPQYGYTASAVNKSTGPKFLRICDINKSSWINWSQVPFCEIDESRLSKYRLRVGDIVIARMADPGHSAFIEDEIDAVFASYLIRFRVKEYYIGRYIQYWLRSVSYWNLINSRKNGSTRANINAKQMSLFPLTIASQPIMKNFAETLSFIRHKVIHNALEISYLENLRDLLLPKLLSGEISIKAAKNQASQVL